VQERVVEPRGAREVRDFEAGVVDQFGFSMSRWLTSTR
jgi:hypothetical protein